jgi:uncharacterized protein YejL (UPF0352 family)
MYLVHLDFTPAYNYNVITGSALYISEFTNLEETFKFCRTNDHGKFVFVATMDEAGRKAVADLNICLTITNRSTSDSISIVKVDKPLNINDFSAYTFVNNKLNEVIAMLAQKHKLTEDQVRLLLGNGMSNLLNNKDEEYLAEIARLKAKFANLRFALDE